MRIITGIKRGKKLAEFDTNEIRPVTDMVKSAIFNILFDRVEGSDWLDLYAGTGSVGLEAVSRGAASVIFVDSSREAVRIIRKNIEITGFSEQSRIIVDDCLRALGRIQGRFHFIFMDPSFHDELDVEVFKKIDERDLLIDGGELILKHFEKAAPPEAVGRLRLHDTRRYGNSKLSFYLKS